MNTPAPAFEPALRSMNMDTNEIKSLSACSPFNLTYVLHTEKDNNAHLHVDFCVCYPKCGRKGQNYFDIRGSPRFELKGECLIRRREDG